MVAHLNYTDTQDCIYTVLKNNQFDCGDSFVWSRPGCNFYHYRITGDTLIEVHVTGEKNR